MAMRDPDADECASDGVDHQPRLKREHRDGDADLRQAEV
jgi:hypothetical protein